VTRQAPSRILRHDADTGANLNPCQNGRCTSEALARVLYTDGVTEARREAELLGEQRVLETVRGLCGRSAQKVAEDVRDAALAYAGKLRDDLQVAVLRRA
jgi:hypothetical protein